MNLLAIDASEKTISICLHQSGQQLELYTDALNRVEQLPRLIKALLGRHSLSPGELGGLSLIHGPGSYTGLRASLLVAKSLALYSQVPVMVKKRHEVSLFAYRTYSGPVLSFQSVRLGQYYIALGQYLGSEFEYLVAPCLQTEQELIEIQKKFSCPVIGDWPFNTEEQAQVLMQPDLAQVLAEWSDLIFVPCTIEQLVPFYVREAVLTPAKAKQS
jgi:tRNA threonylcarbamoyladenosine biosynthesis protein TsaB